MIEAGAIAQAHPFSLPTTRAEWDAYVRAERVAQGLSPEVGVEQATTIAAILIRSRYPTAVQRIRRASQRRGGGSATAAA